MGQKLIAILVLLLSPIFVFAQNSRLSATMVANTTTLVPGQSHALLVQVEIKTGYHAQSNTPLEKGLIPFEVKIDPNPDLEFGKPIFPDPILRTYPQLGKISVFENAFPIFIPVTVKPGAKLQNIILKATLSYQICDDKTCFMPDKLNILWSIPIAEKAQPVNAGLFKNYKPPTTQPAPTPIPTTPPSADAAKTFTPPSAGAPKTLASWFLAAFLTGLIFNIMPCVLPVLPLKILGFHESAFHDRSVTILFGASFCAGVTVAFTVFGLFSVVLNYIEWGQLFSNLYFTCGLATVLLFLSIGLFTPYGFKLPIFLYALSPSHDTVLGNFAWGALTAVLSTSCTAYLLPGVMGAASQQPQVIALSLMATVGFGMGFPYLLLSAFPEVARKFPKTGPFSHLVKQMLGFSLIAVATYFVAGRFIPAPKHWWALLPVAAIASLFLLVRTFMITRKPIPLIISALFAASFPLASYAVANYYNSSTLSWIAYSNSEFFKARQSQKPVLIKFTATWCLNCQYIEATVFHDPKVLELMAKKNIVLIKADITSDTAPGNAFLKELVPTGGIPTTALYSPRRDSPYSMAPILLEGVYTSQTLIDALNAL